MKTKLITVFCLILALANPGSAACAASEQGIAAAYLAGRGIIEGDENGDLNLNKGLLELSCR
jgi:hypothetical protein